MRRDVIIDDSIQSIRFDYVADDSIPPFNLQNEIVEDVIDSSIVNEYHQPPEEEVGLFERNLPSVSRKRSRDSIEGRPLTPHPDSPQRPPSARTALLNSNLLKKARTIPETEEKVLVDDMARPWSPEKKSERDEAMKNWEDLVAQGHFDGNERMEDLSLDDEGEGLSGSITDEDVFGSFQYE